MQPQGDLGVCISPGFSCALQHIFVSYAASIKCCEAWHKTR